MKKRVFLIVVAVLGIFLTSCKSKDVEYATLNVYNWGEYISDGSEGSLDVNKAFEDYYYKKYNKKVKVNYTTYASNEDMYNKLKSGGVSYDIVVPSEYMIARMIDEDMLLKLDFKNIDNYKYIDEQFKNAFYDEKNEYSVPYMCGFVGIIYNSSLIDDEIDDWDCLWNEKYKGQILQFNNPRDAFGTAIYSMKEDVNTTDKDVWDRAKEILKKQKPLVQSYVMDEIFNKMKNGSAAIAPYYAGDYITMYEDNNDLKFCYPKSGTNIFADAMCIPSCAKNKEIAEEYINFCLTEDVAVANAEATGYVSPNVLVRNNEEYIESMTEICENAMEILYPEEKFFSSYYTNLDPETNSYMNSLWESLKIENSVAPWVYILAGGIVLVLLALMAVRGIKRYINAKYY